MKYRVRRLVLGNIILALIGTTIAAVVAFGSAGTINGASLLGGLFIAAAVAGIVRAMRLEQEVRARHARHVE